MADQNSEDGGLAAGFAALLEQQAQMAQQMFGQFSAAADKGDWLNSAAELQKMWLGHVQEQAAKLGDWQALASRDAPVWSELAARLKPDQRREDKRFADPAWQEHPFFDLLHQTYLMLGEQVSALADAAKDVDPAQREQLRFALGVAVDALSPANFAATNPLALAKAVETKGASLVKGLEHLIADLKRGQLSHTDSTAFTVGENIAVTPGKVVHETPLYQLIHYAPVTDQVLEAPLVIFPPWINRYYILDLNPAKSFVRWAVEQGISTFMVSWKSADESMADVVWDDYIAAQIDAVDVVRQRLDVPSAHVIGYCVAGTTLAATLAITARKGEADRFKSATFLTAQVDFSEAGDLKHFIDDVQIGTIGKLAPQGYLDGRYMAASFNLLRPRDLIWGPAIKHYLLGEDYPAFDLLHWNGDVTNLPAEWHAAYLRDLYKDNLLVQPDALSALGTPIDLRQIKTPSYIQAGREDHIAPPQSVWKLTGHLAGPWTFVLAGSGHIAGVVNPPASGKYQHWTNPGETRSLEAFAAGAAEHKGSWWPNWADWLRTQDPATVPAKGKRIPGGKGDQVIEDAPGRYVRTR